MIVFNKGCTDCGKMPTSCTETPEAQLVAGSGDLWVLPEAGMPLGAYTLQECCSGLTDLFAVKGYAQQKKSNFIIEVSSIVTKSVFKACFSCDGVLFSGNKILRTDFASDADYIEGIAVDVCNLLGIPNYTINSSQILFEWSGAFDDCICSSFLFVKYATGAADFTVCGGFVAKNTFKVSPLISTCHDITTYQNNITFTIASLCVTVIKQPECINNNDTYITISFPHQKRGCYRLISSGDCSTPIDIRQSTLSLAASGAPISDYYGQRVVCNTIWIQARNAGENWTAFRFPANPFSPQNIVEQKVFKTPKGYLKKLYASSNTEWTFETDYLDYNTHLFVSNVLEKDYVYIEGVFEYGYHTQIKRMVSTSDYKVDWFPNYIKNGRLGKATFKMREEDYFFTNNYLQ